MDKNNERAERLNVVVAFATFLVIVVSVALIGYFLFGYEPEDIQGQVDCREYRISSKVSGRIVKVMVEEGEYVHVGDTLAILEVPEMEAQRRAAQASEGAAKAMSEMADNGTREEQIRTAAELVRQAEASRTLAQTTYKRMQSLYEDGVTTEQKRDEAKAAYDGAVRQAKAVEEQYRMALNGARKEEREAADATARSKDAETAEVKALVDETILTAPTDGVVTEVFVEPGEIVGSGAPIMNVETDESWFTFYFTEEKLQGIDYGSIVRVYRPASGDTVEARITRINNAGDFASWKATRALEDIDLKVFDVRATPVKKIKSPHGGESAILLK